MEGLGGGITFFFKSQQQPQNIQIKKKSCSREFLKYSWFLSTASSLEGKSLSMICAECVGWKVLILNTVSSCSTSWDGKQENFPSVTASNTDKNAADGGYQARELIQKLQAAGEGRTEGHNTPKITRKYNSKYNSRPHSASPGQNQPMLTITTLGWKKKKWSQKNINIALRSTTSLCQCDYHQLSQYKQILEA